MEGAGTAEHGRVVRSGRRAITDVCRFGLMYYCIRRGTKDWTCEQTTSPTPALEACSGRVTFVVPSMV